MDIIFLGIYKDSDKELLEKLANSISDIEIVWNFTNINIESAKGIALLKKKYNFNHIGIVVEKSNEKTFSSYPLIYEISMAFIEGHKRSTLFNLLDRINKLSLNKLVMAFADEWDENTLVRIEKCTFELLTNRLYSMYVWCETYIDVISNSEVRDATHPLILEVSRQT